MRKEDVLQLPSMPLQSPTYPRGPFRFFNRKYLIVNYLTDPKAIRDALPEPLEPDGNQVSVQWLDLPDGEGFGAYSAAAQVIPCTLKGEPCNFISQMYVNNTSPLAGGREIWGYPMKFGHASLITHGDTLTGSLEYASQITAQGTMTYKPEIAQLIGITFENVTVEGAWIGNARLDLTPSVNCTLADLPVHQVTGGVHLVTSMTLPYGHLLHDYLA